MMKILVFIALITISQAVFSGDVVGFCKNLTSTCTGPLLQFPTAADCERVFNSSLFSSNCTNGATSGDDKCCRVYHGGAPAVADPTLHCPHAGSTGGGACGTLTGTYCNQLQAVCGSEYPTVGCDAIAAAYPVGNVSDTTGNTLQCRLYHLRAGIYLNDTATHCPHTAPHGGSVCGTYTENYCQLVQTACKGANVQFTKNADCLATAGAFPVGTIATDVSGATLACRLYHAKVALSDPNTHCVHAGLTGGAACGTPCQAYCNLIKYACTGPNVQYPDDAACNTACLAFTPGTPGATSGNSFACRFYHVVAGLTTFDNATHCPHAGPLGTGACFDAATSAGSSAGGSTQPKSSAGQSSAGQSSAGQSSAGQSSAGQSTAVKSSAAQSTQVQQSTTPKATSNSPTPSGSASGLIVSLLALLVFLM